MRFKVFSLLYSFCTSSIWRIANVQKADLISIINEILLSFNRVSYFKRVESLLNFRVNYELQKNVRKDFCWVWVRKKKKKIFLLSLKHIIIIIKSNNKVAQQVDFESNIIYSRNDESSSLVSLWDFNEIFNR